jgi:streptogramin lyase
VLKGAYGRIDPEVAMQQVMHGLGTGNLHAVCFDATAGEVWVANAEGDIPNVIDGFNRPFVELDAKAAFAKVRALAAK